MRRAILLSVCAVLSVWAPPARAGLTLTVPSESVDAASGTATLDVNIAGDGSTAFGAFTLSFAITPDASNATAPFETLEFVSPPSDPSLDPTLNNANYVFFGNSLDQDPSSPTAFGTASGTNNTLLTVSDSTDDFSDVKLGSGASALLAELVFKVPTNITNPGGDKFDITLSDPNTSPTALQSNFTGDVSVSGTFMGVVTVEQPTPAPVPEPGTLGMLFAGMTGLFWMKRKQASVDRKPAS